MTTGPIVTLGTAALKTVITRYYKELKGYEGQEVNYELGLIPLLIYALHHWIHISAKNPLMRC